MTTDRQRKLILVLILIGILFVGFFGLRFFRAFREFRGHRPPPFPHAGSETDVELIRDWMTIPYISITYRLPPNLLYETLDLAPKGNQGKSLKQLNDEYFPQAPGIVINKVKATIRANQPPATAPIPDTASPPQTAVPPLTPVPAEP